MAANIFKTFFGKLFNITDRPTINSRHIGAHIEPILKNSLSDNGDIQELTKTTSSKRQLIEIPYEVIVYDKHQNQRDPRRYYYKNKMPVPFPGVPQISSNALFSYEVKSAFYCQDALEFAAGGRREAKIVCRINSILRNEPANPHDSHAIAILIHGRCCGYINRQDNQKLASDLLAAGIVGDVQCRAVITGGQISNGIAANFELSLDLDFPPSIHVPK